MTISVRLTTEMGPPVTYKLIVDAECRSQSILKYKVFLFMCNSLLVVETSLAVCSVVCEHNLIGVSTIYICADVSYNCS